MGSRIMTSGRVAVARLDHGADLLVEVMRVASDTEFKTAEFHAIGALQRARLSFYDQTAKTYDEFVLDEPLEIVSLLGTVTRRDGAPAIHAHAILAGHDGSTHGGHVNPGCIIFAGEVVMHELLGAAPERELDAVTGLPLWGNV